MADNIQSNIQVNIDTTAALASIKSLQRQISAFHTSMAKGGAQAAMQSAQMQQGLINTINATGKFSASMGVVRTTTESFTTALEANKLSMGEYFRYAGGASKSFGKLFKTEFDTINKVARERVKDLQTQYIKMGRNANGAMQAIKVRPLTLDMENLATKTAIAAQKQQLMNQLLKQGSTNLLNFGKNTQWAGRQLMVGFTIPLVMLGTQAAKTFMQLEEQAIKFKRVYGEMFTTSAETDKMLGQVQQLAKEFTKYGVAVEKTMEMAATAAASGKMGADLLAQVTQSTRLAVLGNVEQQQALETTISLTNAFGVSADQLKGKIDFLNAVENQTVTSIEDLTVAIPKAGPVIQQLGGNVEDLAFFLTAMKEGGINASEGANALKSGLASMINPTKKASEFLAGFGINLKGIVEANKGDIKATVIGFATALDKLDPLNRARAIEQLFGKFQFARISTLFKNVVAQGSQASKVLGLTKASTEQLAILSEREMKRISDSPMYKFKKSVEDLKTSLAPLGEQFLKIATPIAEFVKTLLDKFNNLGDGTKSFLVGLTAVLGGLGPIAIMTFGLLANGVAQIIKGFTVVKSLFNKTSSQSKILGESTNYLTSQQIEAAAVAASLDQSHSKLIQTFSSEKSAVDKLAASYKNAVSQQAAFTGAPIAAKAARAKTAKRFAIGGMVRGPGTSTSDSIPANLSNGEAVIDAETVRKNPAIISALFDKKVIRIPGYKNNNKQDIFTQESTASTSGIIAAHGNDYKTKTAKQAREFAKTLKPGYAQKNLATATQSRNLYSNLVFGTPHEFNAEKMSGRDAARWIKQQPEAFGSYMKSLKGIDPNSPGMREFGKHLSTTLGKAGSKAVTNRMFYAAVKSSIDKTSDKNTQKLLRQAANEYHTVDTVSGTTRRRNPIAGMGKSYIKARPAIRKAFNPVAQAFMGGARPSANPKDLITPAAAARVAARAAEKESKRVAKPTDSKPTPVKVVSDTSKPRAQSGAARVTYQDPNTGRFISKAQYEKLNAPAAAKSGFGSRIAAGASRMGVGGGAMALSGLTMAASFIPGQTGQVAQAIAMPLMGIATVLQMIPGPAGLVVAGLTAVAAGAFMVNNALSETAKKAAENTRLLGTSNESNQKFAEFASKVSATEEMNRKRQNDLNPFSVKPKATTFGQSFAGGETGKALITGISSSIAKGGRSGAIADLSQQLSAAVMSNALSPDQARSIANGIAEKLGDTQFGIDVMANLIGMFGPDGTDLTKEPMKIMAVINQQASAKQILSSKKLSAAVNAGFDFKEVGTAAAVGFAGGFAIGLTGLGIAEVVTAPLAAGIAALGDMGVQLFTLQQRTVEAASIFTNESINALEINQSMLDSLELQYQKRLQIAQAAGDQNAADEATATFWHNKELLLGEEKKTIDATLAAFRNGSGLNSQDFTGSRRVLFDQAGDAIKKAYEKDPMQQAHASQVSYAIDTAKGPDEYKYAFKNMVAAKQIGLAQADEAVKVFGTVENGMQDLITQTQRFGTAFINSMLSVSAGFKTDAGKNSFLAMIRDSKTLEGADKIKNTFAAIGSMQIFAGNANMMDAFTKNTPQAKAALADLMSDYEKLRNAKDLTLKIETDVVGKTDMQEILDNEKDFEKLPKEQRRSYIATYSSFANLYLSGDPVAIAEYKKWRDDAIAKGVKQTDYRAWARSIAGPAATFTDPLAAGSDTQTTPGGGTKESPVAGLLKDLQNVRKAAINAAGGVSELLKLFGGNKKFTGFSGIEEQLMTKGYNKDFVSFLSSADKATQDIFMTNKNGVVVLNQVGLALKRAFDAKALGDFRIANIEAIKVIRDELTTRLLARRAGLDYATAVKAGKDQNLALEIATIRATLSGKEQTTAIAQAIARWKNYQTELANAKDLNEKFADAAEKVNNLISNKEAHINLTYDTNIQSIQEDLIKAQDEIATKQFQIDDYEAGLRDIADQEDVINKAYDERIKALDEVQKANEEIASQNSDAIDMAQALASGDITAAARVAQTARDKAAAAAVEAQRAALEKSKNDQIAGLTANVTVNGQTQSLTRSQIETATKNLQKEIAAIEESRVEKYNELIRKAGVERDLALNSLNDQKLKWRDVELAADDVKLSVYDPNSTDTIDGAIQAAIASAKTLATELAAATVPTVPTVDTKSKDVVGQEDPKSGTTTPGTTTTGGGGGGGKIVITKPGAPTLAANPAVKNPQLKNIPVNTKMGPVPSANSDGSITGAIGGAIRTGYEAIRNSLPVQIGGALLGGVIDGLGSLFSGKLFANGGYISGAGTGTSDSIPAMLSNGEYVIKASAVKALGTNTLDKLNNPQKFASGGQVGHAPFIASNYGAGAAGAVIGNRQTTRHTPIIASNYGAGAAGAKIGNVTTSKEKLALDKKYKAGGAQGFEAGFQGMMADFAKTDFGKWMGNAANGTSLGSQIFRGLTATLSVPVELMGAKAKSIVTSIGQISRGDTLGGLKTVAGSILGIDSINAVANAYSGVINAGDQKATMFEQAAQQVIDDKTFGTDNPDNAALARIIGGSLNIAGDPLTYLGVGAAAKAVKIPATAAMAAAKAGKVTSALKNAAKAIGNVPGVAGLPSLADAESVIGIVKGVKSKFLPSKTVESTMAEKILGGIHADVTSRSIRAEQKAGAKLTQADIAAKLEALKPYTDISAAEKKIVEDFGKQIVKTDLKSVGPVINNPNASILPHISELAPVDFYHAAMSWYNNTDMSPVTTGYGNQFSFRTNNFRTRIQASNPVSDFLYTHGLMKSPKAVQAVVDQIAVGAKYGISSSRGYSQGVMPQIGVHPKVVLGGNNDMGFVTGQLQAKSLSEKGFGLNGFFDKRRVIGPLSTYMSKPTALRNDLVFLHENKHIFDKFRKVHDPKDNVQSFINMDPNSATNAALEASARVSDAMFESLVNASGEELVRPYNQNTQSIGSLSFALATKLPDFIDEYIAGYRGGQFGGDWNIYYASMVQDLANKTGTMTHTQAEIDSILNTGDFINKNYKVTPGATYAEKISALSDMITAGVKLNDEASRPYFETALSRIKRFMISDPELQSNDIIKSTLERVSQFGQQSQIPGFKMGGMVAPKYFANGGFAKGSDTIPAMLTPGEFVVKKYAVDNFGVDNLRAINSGATMGSSVYNSYSVNVNAMSNADPNDIARTVITQIRQIDSQQIRSNRF